MRKPTSVTALTDFGRVRLSKTFFMRDFLFSDIASVHDFNNVPDDPDLAIAAGTRLCEDLLEPLQDAFGRLAIRSAYRSSEVNGFGNEMQRAGKSGYTCASNESNYAGHIWDRRDGNGYMAQRRAWWCRRSGTASRQRATGRSSPGGSTTTCLTRASTSSPPTGRSTSPGTSARSGGSTATLRPRAA